MVDMIFAVSASLPLLVETFHCEEYWSTARVKVPPLRVEASLALMSLVLETGMDLPPAEVELLAAPEGLLLLLEEQADAVKAAVARMAMIAGDFLAMLRMGDSP